MEIAYSSETSVQASKTTTYHKPEDQNLDNTYVSGYAGPNNLLYDKPRWSFAAT
jgi:hypothetical protein